jgi:hypothetical protein
MIIDAVPGKLGIDSKIYFYKINSPFARKVMDMIALTPR